MRSTLPKASPPFVGRGTSQRAVRDGLSRARMGRCTIISIEGPVGVGKSRLLEQLASANQGNAICVHVGARVQDSLAISALHQVADAALAMNQDAQAALARRIEQQVGSSLIGELSSLSPPLARLFGARRRPDDASLTERMVRMVGAIADALSAVGTRKQPLLLLIDDIDRADALTSEMLKTLAVEGRPQHTVIVTTGVCVNGVSHETISLGPLERDELRAMLEQGLRLPSDVCDDLARGLVEGDCAQPWAAWSAAGRWVNAGMTEPADQVGGSDSKVQERISRCSPDAKMLAAALAVHRGPIRYDAFVAMLGWRQPQVENAVEALSSRGIVLDVADGRIGFPHESLREMVLGVLEEEQVRQAHARVGQWLSDRGTSQTAEHLERGAPAGIDNGLAQRHVQSGQAAMRVFALRQALWHFERALERSSDGALTLDALEGRGDAAVLNGLPSVSAESVLALIASDGAAPARKIRVAARSVYALWRQQATSDSIRVFHAALASIGEPVPRNTAHAVWIVVTSGLNWMIGRRPLPAEVRDPLCRLYAMMLGVLSASGMAYIAHAGVRGAYQCGELRTASAAASWGLWAAAISTTKPEWAVPVFADAFEMATEAEDDWVLGLVHHVRGESLLALGEYSKGQQHMASATKLFRGTGDNSVTGLSYVIMTVYGRERESLQQLTKWLRKAREITVRQHNDFVLLFAEALRCHILIGHGHDVKEQIIAVSDQVLSLKKNSPDVIATHIWIGRAAVAAGLVDRAERHVIALDVALLSIPPILPMMIDVFALQVEVLLEGERHDYDRARRMNKALASLRSGGVNCPRLRACHLLLHGRVLAHGGDYVSARESLATLIASAGEHGQWRTVVKAHRLMATWLAGSDVVAAQLHTDLAERLDAEHQPPRSGPAVSPPRSPTQQLPQTVAIPRGLTERLDLPAMSQRLAERLSREQIMLQLDLSPGDLGGADWPRGLREVVIELVLLGRDLLKGPGELIFTASPRMLNAAESSEISGGRPGRFGQFTLRIRGVQRADMVPGLIGCRALIERLGGFLKVSLNSDESTVSAYLPIASNGVAVVIIHPNVMLRETIGAAMGNLGYCVTTSASPVAVDYAVVVFSEFQPSDMSDGALWIPVGARGEEHDKRVLQFPFSMADLKRRLEPVADSTGTK